LQYYSNKLKILFVSFTCLIFQGLRMTLLETEPLTLYPSSWRRHLAITNRSRVSCASVIKISFKDHSISQFDTAYMISCYRSRTLSCILFDI